ncbi:MAG: arylsulfatase A-like enzyme [Porticoccaceae bacterium]|jgi:arylsulfatase A-like enzyme
MTILKRRTFVKATASLALGSALPVGVLSAASKPGNARHTDAGLNVLMIVTDQEQSWKLLPPILPLPNRERLKQRGVYFNNAYVNSAICSVSRASIYSGVAGQNNGVWDNTPLPYIDGLNPQLPTLGTILRDQGYATSYFGKWHLTSTNVKMGAEGDTLLYQHGDEQPGPAVMAELFRQYGFDNSEQRGERDGTWGGAYFDSQTAKSSSDFIRANAGGEHPWFTTVNLVNPHDIMFFKATERQQKTTHSQQFSLNGEPDLPGYEKNWQQPLPQNFGPGTRKALSAHQQLARGYEYLMGEIPWDDEPAWHRYRNYYFNCLVDVDTHIGTVLDALEDSGQWDNTLVIFTSDHGEMAGVHGHRGKGGVIYHEACRVPLCICHPGMTGGEESDALVSLLDIVPTTAALTAPDLAAVAIKYPHLVGQDFSGALFDPDQAGPRAGSGALIQWTGLATADAEFTKGFLALATASGAKAKWQAVVNEFQFPRFELRSQMRGIVTGRYKFARYFAVTDHHFPEDFDELLRRNDLELYDTLEDPEENYNLAEHPQQHRALIIALNDKLNTLISTEVGQDMGQHLPGFEFFWNG